MDRQLQKIKHRESLLDLIRLYKDFPILWDPSHEDYYNQEVRRETYIELFESYVKYDRTTNLIEMKNILHNLRAVYRREKKKVVSMSVEADQSKEYKPSLWYYPYLSFIDKYERQTKAATPDFYYYRNIRKKIEDELKTSKQESTLQSNLTDSSVTLDEYSANSVGRAISYQLRELSKLQRCVAEKLIGEILFYAKTDQLNVDTVLNL